MLTGIQLIAEERAEQLEKHGRSVEIDVTINDYYELAVVAQCLIMPPNQEVTLSEELNMLNALAESWDQEVLAKTLQKPYKNRLIIAGALLAAEIDRLQYMEALPQDELSKRITDAVNNFPEAIKEMPGYNNGRFQPVDLNFANTPNEEKLLTDLLNSFEKTRRQEGEEAFWKTRFGNTVVFEPSSEWKNAFRGRGYFVTKVNLIGPVWKLTNFNPEIL